MEELEYVHQLYIFGLFVDKESSLFFTNEIKDLIRKEFIDKHLEEESS